MRTLLLSAVEVMSLLALLEDGAMTTNEPGNASLLAKVQNAKLESGWVAVRPTNQELACAQALLRTIGPLPMGNLVHKLRVEPCTCRRCTTACQCSQCQASEEELADRQAAERKRRLAAVHLEAVKVLFDRLVADDDEGELAGVFEEDAWQRLGRTADGSTEADGFLRELVIDWAFNRAQLFIKTARWELESAYRRLA